LNRIVPAPDVAVYLTDGFGEFPDAVPHYPVLWVVTPGGLPSGGFPFGETARMVGE
jgi:predicted metal-dependent peptidase